MRPLLTRGAAGLQRAACALLLAGFMATPAPAETLVSVALDTRHPGAAIAPDFAGLSFEVSLLLPSPDGTHYFRPDNRPLLDLFRQLGIRSLRLGGNTSDRDAKRLPDEADLDRLFAFAKAADVKVIYCLRLHRGDPQEDARTVKYIMDRYAPWVDCFSIGQEPSAYPKDNAAETRSNLERMGPAAEKNPYARYRDEWRRFAAVIIAAVPNVKFCGPGVHNNADWAKRFMANFGQANHVALITEHLYPGGAGNKVPSPEVGIDRMLSGEFTRKYERLHDGFGPTAQTLGLPCRLEEVNNYFNGGAANVSSTFAAALWGLDFMYWWATHDLVGVNFHTGDRVAAGASLEPSKYTAFFSTTNGYLVRPLGYGLKAFSLGAAGRVVPVHLGTTTTNLNLTAYATLATNGTLVVTLINRGHGPNARAVKVSLAPATHFRNGRLMRLTAPHNDVTATTHVTLGGAEIEPDARWNGTWQPLPRDAAGLFILDLPAPSAAVVRLTTK